jgi:hypothetical protein
LRELIARTGALAWWQGGDVDEGRAHAALVFDGEVAVGWCEYGTPEELPGIYHRKEY